MIFNITSEGVRVGQHPEDYERLLGDIYKTGQRVPRASRRGWFIQIVRPIKTIYNIG